MVKGTSRRVIVVDSPDPKLFEQAIFIVKNDALSRDGVTPQQILGEACRIARGYADAQQNASESYDQDLFVSYCLHILEYAEHEGKDQHRKY